MNKLIEDYSREATRNFVQTIVVLDDEASFDEPQISELTPPSPFDDNEPEPSESENANPRQSPTRFNANEFVRAAAKAGVVGSVIKANLNELKFDVVTNVAKRADILVFDWKLGESDFGETTTRLISEIIGLDAGNRKRFICVYTGETDLDDYAEELRDSLGDDWEVCRQKTDDRDKLKVCNRSKLVDVVFCNKAEVSVEKLPDFLLQEYAESIVLKKTATNEDGQECIETVAGILPSLVMDTISAIRDTTHSLLARYSADLDGALFMHYFKLLAGSKEYLTDNELPKIKANDDNCASWASVQTFEFIIHEINVAIQAIAETYVEKSDKVYSVFHKYINLAEETLKKFKKKQKCKDCPQNEKCDKTLEDYDYIRPYWYPTCNEAYVKLARLASLCQFSRDIQTPSLIPPEWKPVLRTGAVLKKDNSLYICIQAPCDCERCSKTKNSFLFLCIEEGGTLSNNLDGKEGVFFFGLPDGSIKFGETKLEVEAFEKIRFCYEEEEADRPIRSKSEAAPYVFKREIENNDANDKQDDGVKSSDEDNEYYWIGDLRSEVVTMLIQKFYRKMSRFGMNEFEWLRQLTG